MNICMDLCKNCLHSEVCSREPCYSGFDKEFKALLDYLSTTVLSGQPTRCENYKLLEIIMKRKAEEEIKEFVKEVSPSDLIVYTEI